MKTTCSCGAPARKGQRTCLKCHAAYQKALRRDKLRAVQAALHDLQSAVLDLVKLLG